MQFLIDTKAIAEPFKSLKITYTVLNIKIT